MPAVISRVVVLPQPDGPSSATSSPSRISRSSASTAVTDPKRRVSFSSRTSIAPPAGELRAGESEAGEETLELVCRPALNSPARLPFDPTAIDLHQLILRDQEQ